MKQIIQNPTFREVVNLLSSQITTYEDACNLLRIKAELDPAAEISDGKSKQALSALLIRANLSEHIAGIHELVDEHGGKIVISLIKAYALAKDEPAPQGRYAGKAINGRKDSPRIAIAPSHIAKIDAIAEKLGKSRAQIVEMAVDRLFQSF